MKFRIDTAPNPGRRFRLPDERSTARALPVEDRPVKAHVWGPGVATQTHKRTIKASGTQADTWAARRGTDGRSRALHGVRSSRPEEGPARPRFCGGRRDPNASVHGNACAQNHPGQRRPGAARIGHHESRNRSRHDATHGPSDRRDHPLWPSGYESRGIKHGDGNGSDGGGRRLDAAGIQPRIFDSRNRDAFRRRPWVRRKRDVPDRGYALGALRGKQYLDSAKSKRSTTRSCKHEQ